MQINPDTPPLLDGEPRERHIPYDALQITITAVAEDLRYKDGAMPDPVRVSVERALREAVDVIDARAVWVPRPARWDADEEELIVVDTPLRVGHIIGAHVHVADGAALFVVTIGDALESRARSLMKDGHVMEGYALDAVGSAAADACAAWVERDIRTAAESAGWQASRRLSPGYCGWATDEQRKLFALMPDRPGGVRLTESSLMMPIKSVSGIVGLGPDVVRIDYACAVCDREECFRRHDHQS
jgi:hypothetical protein